MNEKDTEVVATFALGCFWSPDDFFSKLDGVIKTRVGYAGGTTPNPTYYNLGDHTETVEITFNPSKISYETLLDHFWKKHDSTIPQSKQYRSVIFVHNKKQREIAEKNLKQIQKKIIGKIAVKNHDNGSLCPKAHFHNKVTLEKVVNAPIIAWPLGLFDCCGNSDGSACAIITRSDIAKRFRADPIYLKGFGIAMDSLHPNMRPRFDWTRFDSLISSSRKAYEMAGIKNPREELDVAEVHDCFSITELIIYENFGFSPWGKAKEDIDSGFFTRHGGLPVNIDGGLKCFGHPIGASGLRMSYEIYKQLQGKADLPERQIKNPRLGLSHTFGGPPQISAVAIFGNEKG